MFNGRPKLDDKDAILNIRKMKMTETQMNCYCGYNAFGERDKKESHEVEEEPRQQMLK